MREGGCVLITLGLDMTNEELLDLMLGMKLSRENGAANVVCFISGFNHDKRELFDIPEVRAFCRRLVDQAFISYLDFCTNYPGSEFRNSLGALEIWLTAEGHMGLHTELTLEMLDEAKEVLLKSNAKADSIFGPFKEK